MQARQRVRSIIGHPADAGNELAAAGMRFAANGDQDDCGEGQERNIFSHDPTLNRIATWASLAHNGYQWRVMPKSSKSLKGQMLLDSGRLQGSFFQRSVILICQHDAEGAFGLILNRGTGNKVGEAVVANLPDTLKQQ